MRKFLILLVVASMAACSASATTARPGESAADAYSEAAFATARMLFMEHNYEEAQRQLAPMVEPARLATFSLGRRRELADLYARASWYGGDLEEGHRGWVILTSGPAATAEDWRWRMMSAAATGDGADSYSAFKRVRQQAPHAFDDIGGDLLAAMASSFAELPEGLVTPPRDDRRSPPAISMPPRVPRTRGVRPG